MDDTLSGRVPRAGYKDVLPFDEAPIARDDIENSGPREALEFRDAQAAVGRSGSDEHALRDDLRPVRQHHDAIRPPGLEPARLAREDVLRPEEPGLLVRTLGQLGAADAARETEVVPDHRTGAGLPAYRFTLDDDGAQSLRGCIHGGRETRRAATDDDEIAGRFFDVGGAERVHDLGVRGIREDVPVEEDD